jgi:hypothetical protein
MTWILRAVAISMLAFAFFPRGAGSSTKTVIVALQGARLDPFLADSGKYPALESLIASGVYGTIASDGAAETTFSRLVAVRPHGVGERRSGSPEYLWQRPSPDGKARITVGFGGGEPILEGTSIVLPGPDPESGFIGSNTGRIQNLRELAKTPAAWPYGERATELTARAAELNPGEAGEWIEIDVPRGNGVTGRGVFRLRRLDDEVAWLTPVFTRMIRGEKDGALRELGHSVYLPDIATWTVPSSRVQDYYYEHVRDVTASRAKAAAALAEARQWSLLVYVDDLLAPVFHAFEDGDSAGRVVEEGYAVVDRRIAELLASAGDAVVVILGFPVPTTSDRGEAADDWYVVAGDGGQSVRVDSSAAALASTLRYLVGVPGSGLYSAAGPVHAVAARYWRRPQRGSSIAVTPPGSEIPLSVDSLRNLGALAPPDA